MLGFAIVNGCITFPINSDRWIVENANKSKALNTNYPTKVIYIHRSLENKLGILKPSSTTSSETL